MYTVLHCSAEVLLHSATDVHTCIYIYSMHISIYAIYIVIFSPNHKSHIHIPYHTPMLCQNRSTFVVSSPSKTARLCEFESVWETERFFGKLVESEFHQNDDKISLSIIFDKVMKISFV